MHPIPRPFELRSEEACSQLHSLPAAPVLHDGLCASHVSRFPAVPRMPDVTQQMFDAKNMDVCCHLIDAQNVELLRKVESDEKSLQVANWRARAMLSRS